MSSPRTTRLVTLLAILLIGAVLRLWHVGTSPSGIHPDEVLYGYDGWSIMTTGCDYRQTGCPPLYLKGYSTNWDNRTSVLYPYMFSLLWRVLPMNEFTLRLPSVVFGVALIFLVYVLARLLRPEQLAAAWGAALLVALAPAAISWSRLGHDPITMPFFTVLMVIGILKAKTKPAWWLLAAAALAIGLYSYQPFKTLGPTVFLLTLWYVRPVWTSTQRRWFTGAALLGLLLASPFLYNQIANWSIVQRQLNQIAIWHAPSPWGRPFSNLAMFIVTDLINPGITLLFLAPLVWLGWRALRRTAPRLGLYLSLWCAVAVFPVLITVWKPGSNNMASRALGLLGPLEILAVYGGIIIVKALRRVSVRRWWQRFGVALSIAGAMTLTLLLSGAFDYVGQGFCCFVLGGMDRAIAMVDRPEYRQRPVVIQFFYFMQGLDLLWLAKAPPLALRDANVSWSDTYPGTQAQSQYPDRVGRFRLCKVEACYHPGDGALYIVPVAYLPDRPPLLTFNLTFYQQTTRWKVVESGPAI